MGLKLVNPFTLDKRSLALMRIMVGLFLLLDLIYRFRFIELFYTESGFSTLELLKETGSLTPNSISFHFLSEELYFQLFLAGIQFLFILMLIVGKWTKFSSFMTWLLMMSLNNKNPVILHGGDIVMQLLLFWGVFLNWGERYSIDSRNKLFNTHKTFDLSNIGYILLLFSVYFFSSLIKSSPEWTTEGSALYYALSLDMSVLPLGKAIYHYEDLLRISTFTVLYLEMLLPFVLFIPIRSNIFKSIFIVAILLLHIGISLTMSVGHFPLISTIILIGLIPSRFIAKIDSKIRNLFKVNTSPAIRSSTKVESFAKKDEESSSNSTVMNSIKLLRDTIICFSILLSFLWNLGNLKAIPTWLTDSFITAGQVLGHNQYWGMFAPGVYKADGWLVLQGTLKNKQKIDLHTGLEPTAKKPKDARSTFGDFRHRKFFEHALYIKNIPLREKYCSYLLNRYNENNSDSLESLEVFYVMEWTLPKYKTKKPQAISLCKVEID